MVNNLRLRRGLTVVADANREPGKGNLETRVAKIVLLLKHGRLKATEPTARGRA